MRARLRRIHRVPLLHPTRSLLAASPAAPPPDSPGPRGASPVSPLRLRERAPEGVAAPWSFHFSGWIPNPAIRDSTATTKRSGGLPPTAERKSIRGRAARVQEAACHPAHHPQSPSRRPLRLRPLCALPVPAPPGLSPPNCESPPAVLPIVRQTPSPRAACRDAGPMPECAGTAPSSAGGSPPPPLHPAAVLPPASPPLRPHRGSRNVPAK